MSTTGGDPIRLVLLGDQILGRASLARLLAAESGFEVAGECGTAAETLEILRASPVDLVLLDLDLGPDHCNCFIREARAAGYDRRFLILAGSVEAQYSATALKLGASGIFLKSEAPERLIQAIRMIATGAVWVDQKIIQLLADECLGNPALTGGQRAGQSLENREQKVLMGVLEGLTNREIGSGMGLTESSVKNILQGLFSKAGVRTRGQLVRAALEGSLGDLPPISRHTPAPVESTRVAQREGSIA